MFKITSKNNSLVKRWRKLHQKKGRKETNSYLIEGFHLIEEALRHASDQILAVMIEEAKLSLYRDTFNQWPSIPIYVVSSPIADFLSFTKNNQGVFAEMKEVHPALIKDVYAGFLLLDSVQDPGNVGTMIRTADAAGLQAVVLGTGSVDLYNEKVLRAAQGSHFHLNVYQGDLLPYIELLQSRNIAVYATDLQEEAISYREVTSSTTFGLIVGNEGAGVSTQYSQLADSNIFVPIQGLAESLNVSIAAGILIFHLQE